MQADGFYVAEGEEFLSTDFTRGPWSPDYQHGGPPSALLARCMERETTLRLVRLTVELIRPVPVTRLRVGVRVTGGKRVCRLVAELTADGELICQAHGLAIRQTRVDFGDLPPATVPDLPGPPSSRPTSFPFFEDMDGYHTAIEQRHAAGDWGQREASLWMRPRVPLIVGEPTSPFQRVAICADSNNGVTNVLDKDRFIFINPDLTVHLFREPVSDWTCLHAVSHPQPTGVGLAESLLLDEEGPVGRSVQSLFVDERR